MTTINKKYVAESSFERKLRLYLKNNFNVLFIGEHGTGKTSIIKALWDNEGIKYRIFSASTMDPWVDFIGVPKEKLDEASGKMYLELIRPIEFAKDEIEAIFIDEYNRGHAKIRNAVMELIQFKSINGFKFNNLRVVWAAINPDEDGRYDVERLDPAQKDRFHIHIELPYEPSKTYFIQKYGQAIGETACDWWKAIKDKEILRKVSPRRLDYSLEVFLAKGSLSDVLPKEANPDALGKLLKQSSPLAELKQLIEDKNTNGIKTFIEDENNYDFVISEITKNIEMMKVIIPLMPPEKINTLVSTEIKVQVWALKDYEMYPEIKASLEEIAKAGLNTGLANQIKKRFLKGASSNASVDINNKEIDEYAYVHYNDGMELKDYAKVVETLFGKVSTDIGSRKNALELICKNISIVLDKNTCLKTMEIIDFVIGNTHKKQIETWGFPVMGIINSCVVNLSPQNYDFSDFGKKYPNIMKYVVENSGFYFKI